MTDLLTVVIAICALVVSVWALYSQRVQHRREAAYQLYARWSSPETVQARSGLWRLLMKHRKTARVPGEKMVFEFTDIERLWVSQIDHFLADLYRLLYMNTADLRLCVGLFGSACTQWIELFEHTLYAPNAVPYWDEPSPGEHSTWWKQTILPLREIVYHQARTHDLYLLFPPRVQKLIFPEHLST
jgi:hypothetical protein